MQFLAIQAEIKAALANFEAKSFLIEPYLKKNFCGQLQFYVPVDCKGELFYPTSIAKKKLKKISLKVTASSDRKKSVLGLSKQIKLLLS